VNTKAGHKGVQFTQASLYFGVCWLGVLLGFVC
jgi:hypothetical protein